jgi:putative flippase GtrA
LVAGESPNGEFRKAAAVNRGMRMFGRHTVASTIAFALDLALLWSLVELIGMAHLPAAIIAFFVPMTLAYVLEREWVFPGTRRGVAKGYLYFAVNVGIGSLLMLATFWALMQFGGLHYLIARILASFVAGIAVFLLNGVFNFKQL